MNKTAIVTDSTSYIPSDIRNEYGIAMVPLNVMFGDDMYQEETDITTTEFYEKMKTTEALPTTSQPSIGLFEETFTRLAKTADDILVITLSSGISGTFETAHSAAQMVEGANVYLFDSEVSCYVQGFYVITAAKLAEDGMKAKQILSHLEKMKKRTRAYFMADDLNHLHRGGRLNGAQMLVGSLLQVKPVLHFDDKKIVPYEKVRTAKKAIAKILGLLHEDAKFGAALDVVVIHANRPEKAEELKKYIKTKYPDVNVTTSHFGPVIGTHLGEGSLGIGWTDADLTI